MKFLTTLVFSLFSVMLYAQSGTIRVTAPCFGVDPVDFSYDGTVNGRNQYVDDDGDPTSNASLRIAYNPGETRWEIQTINDPSQVFYATETNAFAPDPPSSTAATYSPTNLCSGVSTDAATVVGSGTQETAGGDPCAGAGGDDDNDGVCNDVDACPGFDDGADRDGDGIPDGCDPSFDGVAITSSCFGGATLDFVLTGTDATGRNIYTNTFQFLEIAFNDTEARWEVRVTTDPTTVYFTNSVASLPDPPSSAPFPYDPAGGCTDAPEVVGGGTQDSRCLIDAATCDDGIECTEDFLDENCVCQHIDNTPPVAICQNATVYLDELGNASLTPAEVDNGSSDDCGAVTLSLDRTQFSCSDLGDENLTVTLMATDEAFRSAVCTSRVTVLDTLAPTASDPATSSYVCDSDVPAPDPAVVVDKADNCGVATVTYIDETDNGAVGNAADPRIIVRRYRITDVAGNFVEVFHTIKVVDDEPPVLVVQDVTFPLDENGEFVLFLGAINRDIIVSSSDNCGLVEGQPGIGVSKFFFTCNDIGANQVTIYNNDVNGNQTARTVTLTITDPLTACNQQPVASCKSPTIPASGDCQGIATAEDFDNGSTDPDGDPLTFSVSPAGPYPLGTTNVTLTVTDDKGAASTCTTTVTVQDNTPPVVTCSPFADVVYVGEDGLYLGSPGFFTTSDNCDAAVDLTESYFDEDGNSLVSFYRPDFRNDIYGAGDGVPFPPGQNRAEYLVTDDAGLSAFCSFILNVVDTIPPDITCVSTPQSRNNDPGECYYTALGTEFDPTATDNCGNVTLTNDYNNGSTLAGAQFPVGTTTVTFTATDDAGNQSESCSFTVTVSDNEAPVAKCQSGIIVLLNEAGLATLPAGVVNMGSSDNCGIASLSLNQTTFGCEDLGPKTVTLTVTDVNGNSSECSTTVTVEDNFSPTAVCQPIEVFMGLGGNYTLNDDDVDAIGGTSTDNCAVSSVGVIPNNFSALGTFPVTLTATDVSGNTDDCQTTVTVRKRPTTLVYQGEKSVQYSDAVALQAQLIDDLSGGGIAGQEVIFTIGDQTVSATTDASGVATASLLIDQQPSAGCASDPVNNYAVEVIYAGTTELYEPSSDEDPFTIAPEDARITYTGSLFVSTTSKNSSTADVLLSATVRDISLTAEANGDLAPGDISYATVDFIDRDGGVINATPVPVVPIDPSDPTVGVAVYNWEGVDIGNADSENFAIGIRVCGYYSRDAAEDDEIVTISRPLDKFVTGGGYLILKSSAGSLAGDVGSKNNFGFNIRYNKSGTKLQGKIRTLIRRTEADGVLHTYQVKGNKMTSLAFDPGTGQAIFYGKANVQDVTDPDNPLSVFGNGDFQVTMTDNGEPGDMDLIGLTLYDNDGGLRFSSHWDGTQTVEQMLDGGNLSVHGETGNGGGSGRKLESRKARITVAKEVRLEVFPNPSQMDVTLAFTLTERTPATLDVYNLAGVRVAHLFDDTAEAGKPYQLTFKRRDLPAGTYIYRLQTTADNHQGKFVLLRH